MPLGSTIIGVDLMPIKSIRGVITLQQDITTPQCRTAIRRHLQKDQLCEVGVNSRLISLVFSLSFSLSLSLSSRPPFIADA